jgi:hypothetical protein
MNGSRDSTLTAFLLATGWQRISSGSRGEMFQSSRNGESVNIAVPFDLEGKSNDEQTVVRRLSEILGLRPSKLLEQIVSAGKDFQDFRIPTKFDQPESISVSAASLVLQTAQRLMRAAATTSIRPRAAINGSYAMAGDAIARKIQLGHTKAGSFVFPVYLEVDSQEAGDSNELPGDFGKIETSERRVTRTLATALGALKSAVLDPDTEPTGDTLLSLIESGVSRELVRTLRSAVSPSSGLGDFSIDFRWSPIQEPPGFIATGFDVSKGSEYILDKLETRLAASRLEADSMVSGQIIEIREESERGKGHIAISTMRNNRKVEIVAIATTEQVFLAYEWARSRRAVAIRGIVERVPGKALVINQPIAIVPMDQLFVTPE